MTADLEGKMIGLVRDALRAHSLALPGVRLFVSAYLAGGGAPIDEDPEKARRRIWNLNEAFHLISGHNAFVPTSAGFGLTESAQTWLAAVQAAAEQQQSEEVAAVQSQADNAAVMQKLSDLGPDGLDRLIAVAKES